MRTVKVVKVFLWVVGLLLFSGGVVQAADVAGQDGGPDRIAVFVSIVPQQYFLEKIGGDHVDVSVMVMPGASPATYEPTSSQMIKLAKAKAYFAVGVPFESTWLPRFTSANPNMLLVHTEEGIHKVPMLAHGPDHEPGGARPEDAPAGPGGPGGPDHDVAGGPGGPGHGPEPGHGHEHGVLDPHIWLAPRLVKVMAENICRGLVAVDPAHTGEYRRNLAAFQAELDDLDGQLRTVLAPLSRDRRAFMVFHPAWGYFARDYGLRQIPIECEGKEPSPAELAKIVKLGRERHIPVVFVQPQFSERSAKVIASEMGAEVVPLNPLAADWRTNLLKVAEAFRNALE